MISNVSRKKCRKRDVVAITIAATVNICAARAQTAPDIPNDAAREEIKQACDDFRQTLIDADRIVITSPSQLDKLAGRNEKAFWRRSGNQKIRTETGGTYVGEGVERPAPPSRGGSFIVIDEAKAGKAAAPVEQEKPPSPDAPELFERFRTSHDFEIMEGNFHSDVPLFGCHFYEFTVMPNNKTADHKLLYAAPAKFSERWSRNGLLTSIKWLSKGYWANTKFDAVRGDRTKKIIWEFWQEYLTPDDFHDKCAQIEGYYKKREEKIRAETNGVRATIIGPSPTNIFLQDGELYRCSLIKFDVDEYGRPFNIFHIADDAVSGRQGFHQETSIRERYYYYNNKIDPLPSDVTDLVRNLQFEPAVSEAGEAVPSYDHYFRLNHYRKDWKEETAAFR